MEREIGEENTFVEAQMALARLRIGERFDARGQAERLSEKKGSAIAVAEIWRELGENDRAIEYALRAHAWAAADGEPYVYRYDLDRARTLLVDLGALLPEVPRHDPSRSKPFPWENDIRVFIEELRTKRATKEAE